MEPVRGCARARPCSSHLQGGWAPGAGGWIRELGSPMPGLALEGRSGRGAGGKVLVRCERTAAVPL